MSILPATADTLELADALIEVGELVTAKDVLYFFEKPWKWEHVLDEEQAS